MIYISYGSDIAKITYDTLVMSDISKYLSADYNVALKPNLVVPGPASNGAVTHPEVAEGVILYLREFGVKNIRIIESSWVGDSTKRAFKYCGYEELSRKHNVPLIDLKSDDVRKLSHSGYEIAVCKQSLDTDFLINLPVLKAHCQTRLTCCLKNLKGCIPDSEKRRFHTLGIHKPVAALNMLIKTGYCVVDGICGDLTFEEGGNPVTANRIIAGRDPLMIDSYCAELIGYMPHDVQYLSFGEKIGVGKLYTPDVEVIEQGTENKPKINVSAMPAANRYRNFIDEDSACSACYSTLIHAIHRLHGRVKTDGKIHIGQGFVGKSGNGVGVGVCAKGFSKNVPGCPPKATDIIEMLR